MHQPRRGGDEAKRHGVAVDPLDELRHHDGPGIARLKELLAAGGPTVAEAMGLMFKYYLENDAIVAMLQQEKGNAFVQEVDDLVHATLPPTPEEQWLAWRPTAEKGADGEAAWLLKGAELGFVDASGETKRHLQAYVAGKKSVDSFEKMPGPNHNNGIEPKSKSGKYGTYEVKIGEAPILEVLVHLVRAHGERWHKQWRIDKKWPQPIFDLGTMLRRDPGFGGGKGSRHTTGQAIDLGGMNFETVDDVLGVLEDLPPGGVSRIFPDNDNHLHLSIENGGFELGLPTQGDFFPDAMKLDRQQQQAEAGATAGQTTITARGLEFGQGTIHESTGTLDPASGKWKWSKSRSTGTGVFRYLRSQPLKDKLTELGFNG